MPLLRLDFRLGHGPMPMPGGIVKIVLTDCICSECRDASAAGKFYRFMVDFWGTILAMGLIMAFWWQMIEWSFKAR